VARDATRTGALNRVRRRVKLNIIQARKNTIIMEDLMSGIHLNLVKKLYHGSCQKRAKTDLLQPWRLSARRAQPE